MDIKSRTKRIKMLLENVLFQSYLVVFISPSTREREGVIARFGTRFSPRHRQLSERQREVKQKGSPAKPLSPVKHVAFAFAGTSTTQTQENARLPMILLSERSVLLKQRKMSGWIWCPLLVLLLLLPLVREVQAQLESMESELNGNLIYFRF